MNRFAGDFGIAFSRDDKSMQDKDWKYDSRKPKWTVDPKADPPHLDLFEMDGGTKYTPPLDTPFVVEEVLFEIEHHMPFPPLFFCYFYVIASGGLMPVGCFTLNRVIMYESFAAGTEMLYAKVDDTHFRIIHLVDAYVDSFVFPGGFTFTGSDYLFRIRYELINKPAFYLGDKGY